VNRLHLHIERVVLRSIGIGDRRQFSSSLNSELSRALSRSDPQKLLRTTDVAGGVPKSIPIPVQGESTAHGVAGAIAKAITR
jgi:hypothetical protein